MIGKTFKKRNFIYIVSKSDSILLLIDFELKTIEIIYNILII